MGDMMHLSSKFSVLDGFTGPVGGMLGSLHKLCGAIGLTDKRLKKLGLGLAMVAGAAMALGVLNKAAEAAGGFQTEVQKLALISQASAQELEKLRKQALNLGVITEWSPNEAVQGMTALASMGVKASDQMKLIPDVLNLATAGMGDLGQSSRTVVSVLKQFQMSTGRASEVTDKLTRMTQISSFQLQDMEQAMAAMGATANRAQQSLSDTLAVAGMIKNLGYSSQDAAQKVNQMMRALIVPSRVAIMYAKRLGISRQKLISAYRDESGKMRPVADIMSRLTNLTKGMTKVDRDMFLQKVLGADGMAGYTAIMNGEYKTMRDGREVTLRGVEALKAMSQELDKSGGTTKKFAEKMKETWAGVKKMLQGSLETFVITLGQGPMIVIKRLLIGITNILNPVLAFFQANEKLTKSVGVGITVFVAMIGILGALKAIAAITGAVMGAAWFAAFWPIGLVIAGIGLVAAGFYLLWQKSETFRDAIRAAWDVAETFIASLTFGFRQVVGSTEEMLAPLRTAWDLFTNALKPAVDAFMGAISALFPGLTGTGDSMINIAQIGIRMGKGLGVIFQEIIGFVAEGIAAFGKFLAAVVNIATQVVVTFTGIWDALCDGFDMVMADVFNPAAWLEAGIGLVTAIIDGVKRMSGAIYDALKELLGPLGKLLPGSDAEEGPLSRLTASGKAIPSTIAHGATETAPDLKSAVSQALDVPTVPNLRDVNLNRPVPAPNQPVPVPASGETTPQEAGKGIRIHTLNVTLNSENLSTLDDLVAMLQGLAPAEVNGA